MTTTITTTPTMPGTDLPWVAPLSGLRLRDAPRAGGKAVRLAELMALGLEVPDGFVVTADAFVRFMQENGLADAFASHLAAAGGATAPAALEEASRNLRAAIASAPVPAIVAEAIAAAYGTLCDQERIPDLPVAVRPSGATEDGRDAEPTPFNVRGTEALVAHVRRVWAGLCTLELLARHARGAAPTDVRGGVLVQRMVPSESAGVVRPLEAGTTLVVASAWGLGLGVRRGIVRPDRFVVDQATLSTLRAELAHKHVQVLATTGDGTLEDPLPTQPVDPERADAPSLTPEEVAKLAGLAVKAQAHFGAPHELEFAVEWLRSSRRIRIVGARPAPGLTTAPTESTASKTEEPLVRGLAASPGVHSGRVRVVASPAEALQAMQPGDVLVTRMLTPDWSRALQLAGAVVTEDGGTTCHAAILSREMGLPCIVGARDATHRLRDGSTCTVDARSGLVLDGTVRLPMEEATAPPPSVTSTKVLVNLSIPELADKVARETHADGVGLLRAEHMLLSIGRHPRTFIEEGRPQDLVDAFAAGIRKVAAAFAPRPVVYRFLDLKPDEFVGLPGGERHERAAGHVGPNPLLGYRGCFRYQKEPDLFRLECQALRKVRDEFGLRNVHAMLPFVRTLREFQAAKRLLDEAGLRRGRDFHLWMMVEVPATVLTIERFLDDGVDGVSFGTNDLTMLVLGIDRDDASVQELYDERNPAVLRALEHVLRACRAAGIPTSVCGQAPSNHPELVDFLVREGATSLSVSPDRVAQTRRLVAATERRLLLEGVRNLHGTAAGGRPSLANAPPSPLGPASAALTQSLGGTEAPQRAVATPAPAWWRGA